MSELEMIYAWLKDYEGVNAAILKEGDLYCASTYDDNRDETRDALGETIGDAIRQYEDKHGKKVQS